MQQQTACRDKRSHPASDPADQAQEAAGGLPGRQDSPPPGRGECLLKPLPPVLASVAAQ